MGRIHPQRTADAGGHRHRRTRAPVNPRPPRALRFLWSTVPGLGLLALIGLAIAFHRPTPVAAQATSAVASITLSPEEATIAPGDPFLPVKARLRGPDGKPVADGSTVRVNWTIKSVGTPPPGGDQAAGILGWLFPKTTTTVGEMIDAGIGRCRVAAGAGETCILVSVPSVAPKGFVVEIGAVVTSIDGPPTRATMRVRVIDPRAVPTATLTPTVPLVSPTPVPPAETATTLPTATRFGAAPPTLEAKGLLLPTATPKPSNRVPTATTLPAVASVQAIVAELNANATIAAYVPSPTVTMTETVTPTVTVTETATATETVTPTPTLTPTLTPSVTVTEPPSTTTKTPAPVPTEAPKPTATPSGLVPMLQALTAGQALEWLIVVVTGAFMLVLMVGFAGIVWDGLVASEEARLRRAEGRRETLRVRQRVLQNAMEAAWRYCSECGDKFGLLMPEEALSDTDIVMQNARMAAPKDVLSWIRQAFGAPGTKPNRQVQLLIVAAVYSSVGLIVIDSVVPIHEEWGWLIAIIENVFLFIFALEYAATIFAARNRWGYVFSAWGILDILALLPAILASLNLEVLRVLRLLRLLRMLRVLKLVKAARAGKATGQSNTQSDLQTFMVALFCLVMIGSTLAYFAEEGAIGTAVPNIAAGIWWSINILGGVNALGPVTVIGKGIAVVVMFVSMMLIAALIFMTEMAGVDDAKQEASFSLSGVRLTMRHLLVYFGVARAGGSGFALPPPPVAPPGARPGTPPPPPPPPPPLPPRFDELRRCPDCTVTKGPMPTWYTAPAAMWLAQRTQARTARERALAGDPPAPPAPPPGIRGVIVRAFGRPETTIYTWTQLALLVVVYISVGVFLLDTVPELAAQYEGLFQAIEGLTSAIFIGEFLFSYYAAVDRGKYLKSVWGIIDLLTVIPAVIGVFDTLLVIPAALGLVNLSGLRLMRSVRILRVLRVLRALKALRTLKGASPLADVRSALQTYLVILFASTVIIGAVAFEVETISGTETFASALEGVWWALNKLAGVEAGSPISPVGQGLSAITVFVGIGLWGYLIYVIRLAMYGREGARGAAA